MPAPVLREKWLKVTSNLHVDRKGSIAPHKPLLLLMLAELAEQGKLTERTLLLTGELVFRFLTYWTVVAERRSQRPDIHLPFYHMRSDGCWMPLDDEYHILVAARRFDESGAGAFLLSSRAKTRIFLRKAFPAGLRAKRSRKEKEGVKSALSSFESGGGKEKGTFWFFDFHALLGTRRYV